MNKWASVLILVILSVTSLPAVISELTDDLTTLLDELSIVSEELYNFNLILVSLKEGDIDLEDVDFDPNWDNWAENYHDLRENVKVLKLDFEMDNLYQNVHISELNTEKKIQDLLNSMDNHIKLYNEKFDDVQEMMQELQKALDEANYDLSLLRETLALYKELVGFPIFVDLIKWDWFVIENKVRPNLGKLIRELNRKVIEFNDEIESEKILYDNLVSNRNTLLDLM